MKSIINKYIGLTLCLVTTTIACGDESSNDLYLTSNESASSALLATDPVLSSSDAEMKWRFIGIKNNPNVDCPKAPPPFATRHLFSSNPNAEAGDIPPGLRPYCLYEGPITFQSPGSIPQQLANLILPPGVNGNLLTALEPDHQAVAPFGSTTMGDVMKGTFSDELDEHADRFGALPLRVSHKVSGIEQTRLSIMDTVPTYEPVASPTSRPSHSTHGHALTNIAENLVCDNSSNCTAKISTQLAMPLIRAPGGSISVDTSKGGYFGSIGWLAEALRGEVVAWQNAIDGVQGNNRLVVNLSLGWSPDFGGSSGARTSWPVDVKAVYSALEDLHCRGGLGIAAAGNVSNGPSGNSGPILPAAWEQRQAPSRSRCNQVLGHDWDPSLTGASVNYRPILFAASGVDYKGDPIAISREGGLARIAGYADHAVTVDANGDYTATLTGTSVSAVVVASAAATAWFYRPEEPLYDIMQFVYRGGQRVGTRADFCRWGGSSCSVRTRRATICSAAERACMSAPSGGNCPSSFGSCTTWDKSAAGIAALDYSSFDSGATDYEPEYAGTTTTDATCGTIELAYAADYSSSATCPDLQFYSGRALPWTIPQPEGDPCPNCAGYMSTDEVRLTNPYGFSSYSSPTLSVTDYSGRTTNYSLGSLSGTSINVYFGSSVLSGSRSMSFSGLSGGVSYSSSVYLGY